MDVRLVVFARVTESFLRQLENSTKNLDRTFPIAPKAKSISARTGPAGVYSKIGLGFVALHDP
jgi:hypothetical protein